MSQPPAWQVKNEGSFASVSIALSPRGAVHCESGAVVTTSHNVGVRGQMSGGILAGLARAFLTRESFFTTVVKNNSPNQMGDALIAPSDPGGVTLHRMVRGEEMILTSGAYLAGDEGVTVSSSMQSPFSMFGNFSGTGSFLLRASGQGTLAMSAYGSMHKYVLAPGERRNVDNGHLVAWSANMQTSMKLASAGVVGSMTSGEGLHCEFVGPGVIYIQSHKPGIGPDGAVKTRNGGGSGGNFILVCITVFFFIVLLGFFIAVYFGTSNDFVEQRGYRDRTYQRQQNGGYYGQYEL